MHFQTSIILAIAATASAHMKMGKPVPFGVSTLNNSPLAADGSDFPCKQRPGVYDAEGANNVMAIGSTQPLLFIGGATHGGGSCQISISYDAAPTKSSVWKVIHSIEGGCPTKTNPGNTGNDANAAALDTYSFTVPDIPTGTAVLAWTWNNKVGNRELYMNCAPVTITGSGSKRSLDDLEDLSLEPRNVTQLRARDGAFDALPDMFVANIGNGCSTPEGVDIVYPNPGASVEKFGSGPEGKPVGNCGSTGGSTGGAPAAASPATPPKSSAPAASPGVFVTVAPAAPSAPAPATATTAPAAVAPLPASSASPAPAPATTPAAPSAPASNPPTTGSSGGVQSGPCSPEGQWNCIGGSQFQRCASGTWSVAMALSAGTSCASGISSDIKMVTPSKAKRSVRFSGEHIRRHLHRSS